LPLIIISVFEVIRNNAKAKNIVLDYYDNNPEWNYNKKNSKNVYNTQLIIYNNYLTIL